MSFESALHAIGTADATLNALIAGRLVRDSLPLNYPLPAVVYRRVAGAPEMAHDGPAGVAIIRVQFDCWAANPTAAETLAEAVEGAYGGYRATAGGRKIDGARVVANVSFPEPDTQLSRRIVDIRFLDAGDA